MVNKKTKTKLIEGNGSNFMKNPAPGTVLDHTISSKEHVDFYMVCTETRQGVPTPSHFTIIANDNPNVKIEEIMRLCFKLCYSFYNFSGPVKTPAPIKYAGRQASFVSEINCRPHDYHQTTKSLFFI